MNFWIKFWTILLFGGFGLFVCMAISVAIGGIFDIISLFKKLTTRADRQRQGENSSQNHLTK